MTSIHDVAAYVLERFDEPISTMKLQKLVYLAQGWKLGMVSEPMYPERHEAWANGPVSRDLFRHHRKEFSVGRWPYGNPKGLSEVDEIIVDAVISNYGALSGKELSDLTHVSGTPWSEARKKANVQDGQPSQIQITTDSMETHFQKLLASPL